MAGSSILYKQTIQLVAYSWPGYVNSIPAISFRGEIRLNIFLSQDIRTVFFCDLMSQLVSRNIPFIQSDLIYLNQHGWYWFNDIHTSEPMQRFASYGKSRSGRPGDRPPCYRHPCGVETSPQPWPPLYCFSQWRTLGKCNPNTFTVHYHRQHLTYLICGMHCSTSEAHSNRVGRTAYEVHLKLLKEIYIQPTFY